MREREIEREREREREIVGFGPVAMRAGSRNRQDGFSGHSAH